MNVELGLACQRLINLAKESYDLRNEYPPLTRRADGKYEGDILAFVKGLRISSLLIYCLREWLSDTPWEVSWGHILNQDGQMFSPECDIIIHKGHVRQWNGDGGGKPIMDFKFVRAAKVLAVVSCKSEVKDVDPTYPNQLRRFGINRVYLFGECCSSTNYTNLVGISKNAGYSGFWCSYYTEAGKGPIHDEIAYSDFFTTMRALVDAAKESA